MKYNIGIVVGEVNEMKTEFDFTWNISNIRNTIVKPLDTNNLVMNEPSSPPRYHNYIAPESDLLPIDLYKYASNTLDLTNLSFKEKYMLLQIHLEKEKNEFLSMQLHV